MVNDQLIRIHHMRLLSYDKMMTKQLEERRAAAACVGAVGSDLQASSSAPSSPTTQSRGLSSSAPETDRLSRRHSYINQQEHQLQIDDCASLGGERHKERHQEPDELPISKSHSFLPAMKGYTTSGKKFKEENLEHSYNGTGGGGGGTAADKNPGSQPMSNKKKSPWRHLLSPSYKSRSDEFHKFFADKIPADERLIADYSCALHREILIQGRVYISINYIAFYSNLFSWITKLVVRLRDIADIYKANTARIIPNAIQIVTNSGEKHVFASFIARDKSYIMFWRIWRNNLLMERMTDEELRSLVHMSYGKDLGMSTDEELKINSPDPKTPSDVGAPPVAQESSPDGNNNNGRNKSETSETGLQSAPEVNEDKQTSCDRAIDEHKTHKEEKVPEERGQGRYNSIDYSNNFISDADRLTDEQAQVVSELKQRLHNNPPPTPPEGRHGSAPSSTVSPWIEITNSPNASSNSGLPVEEPQIDSDRQDSTTLAHEQSQEGDDKMIGRGTQFRSFFGRKSTGEESESTMINKDSVELSLDGELPKTTMRQEPDVPVGKHEDPVPERGRELSRTEAADNDQSASLDGDSSTTNCDCESHDGMLVADEQFDISVDTLFSLIFTNSKFMRAHMIQRGMKDTIVSKWRRSTNGDKSNSSTLSRSVEGDAAAGTAARAGNAHSRSNSIDSNIYLTQRPSVKTRQQRQIKYSMNINHVMAKHIQVEEKQNICSVKPGVYVLKSQAINSGVPFSESFTVDLTYCMTRAGHRNRSRMLVHGGVNFIKDKHSWKLAMVKSVIEKQSVQGINEFVFELIERIREYVARKRQQQADLDQVSLFHQDQELYTKAESQATAPAQATTRHQRSQTYNKSQAAVAATKARSSRSLVRAKSKRKERELRNMYKYYIHASGADGATNQSDEPPGQPDGRISGTDLGTESDDSLESSPGDGSDDNDSMIMMVTTHETEPGSQLGETADQPVSRAQSFSDLEWGQSMDDDDDDDEEDDSEQRGNVSETSNVTINNGNIATNYRSRAASRTLKQAKRRFWSERAGDGLESAKLVHGHLSSGAPRCATCGSPLAAGSRGRPLAHYRVRSAFHKRLTADRNGVEHSAGPLLKGLFCKRNLVILVITLLTLLLCTSLALHWVVLRRLSGIETRLSANCLDRWPAANQSSARHSLL